MESFLASGFARPPEADLTSITLADSRIHDNPLSHEVRRFILCFRLHPQADEDSGRSPMSAGSSRCCQAVRLEMERHIHIDSTLRNIVPPERPGRRTQGLIEESVLCIR